ncbi:hypothetical protein MK280_01860 [Myxococcota bacterium]|nr:hypothetical protein [Myxococcota bacterium]
MDLGITAVNQTLTVPSCPAHAPKDPLDILLVMILAVGLSTMISLSWDHSAERWCAELLDSAVASTKNRPLHTHSTNRSVANMDVVGDLLSMDSCYKANNGAMTSRQVVLIGSMVTRKGECA